MKRVADLRGLSDDHHAALALARRCQRAGRADAADSLASVWPRVLETFAARVEPHIRIVELHLLPALEAIGAVSAAARLRADHAALRTLRSTPPSRATLADFGRLLERHVRFEEREVFGLVQDRIAAGAFARFAAACRAIVGVAPVSLEAQPAR